MKKDKLIIRDIEDGKARIISDFSFKKDNLEAVKKDKSRKDIRRIDQLWNELLDSDISLVDLKTNTDKISKSNKEFDTKINMLLESQIQITKQVSQAVELNNQTSVMMRAMLNIIENTKNNK